TLTIWAGVCGVRIFFVCHIIRAMCELRPASHMLPVYPTYPYLRWSQSPLRDCTRATGMRGGARGWFVPVSPSSSLRSLKGVRIRLLLSIL
ncbi:hypothetical protein K438DRAFT_1811548, partial [Mycena galopus ATCC 62051]